MKDRGYLGDNTSTNIEQAVEDDLSIHNETLLYRRILNQPNPPVKQIVWDDNRGGWRPSRAAFTDHPNGSGMSVGIDDTYKNLDIPPTSMLEGHKDFSLAAFPAKIPREKEQKIIRAPTNNDPAHGEVLGKKTKGVQRAIVNASQWVLEPELSSEK